MSFKSSGKEESENHRFVYIRRIQSVEIVAKVQYKLFNLLNVLKSGLYLLKSANSTKPKSFLEHELSKKD